MSPDDALQAAYLRQRGYGLPHFRGKTVLQRGSGPFHSAVDYQSGLGLGSFLRSMVRTVMPILKKPIVRRGLKRIGKAAANTVLEAGQTALSNKVPFSQALKQSAQAQGRDLLQEARQKLVARPRSTAAKGQPIKRKPRTLQTVSVVKRRRKGARDIFG